MPRPKRVVEVGLSVQVDIFKKALSDGGGAEELGLLYSLTSLLQIKS
jgi:hypothetical protein